MIRKLKILIAAAEVTPLAKVGGLGDVISALPKALVKLNVDVRIIIPFYDAVDRKKYKIKLIRKNVEVATSLASEKINLWQTQLPQSKVPTYLIEHNFFKGQNIYSSKLSNKIYKIYPSNLIDIEKFIFFSHAILESIKSINFKPNLIHLNDWHTAPIALYLKSFYKADHFFKDIKTLYTIHNLANQGIANPKIITLNKLDKEFPSIRVDLRNKDINLMVQGIVYADLISTVSPTYAREILTHKFGAGLNKVLLKRKNNLIGILNGVDTNFFNPITDKFIKRHYSLKTLKKKIINKLALQKKLGLPQNKDIALVGLVSRLVWQKGVDLINDNLVGAISANRADRHELPLPCQFVILGTGQVKYEKQLKLLAKNHSDQISAQIKFDESLAHLIYAGSDIFLMPSRFEPCGLGQMIAMRYGSVPIIRRTGGLADTVYPVKFSKISDRVIKKEVGFSFEIFSAKHLLKTLRQALNLYYNFPKKWKQLQINGMKKNFSWDKSAKEYIKLYKKAIYSVK